MSGITLPPGAFAAAKSGTAQPTAKEAPAPAKVEPQQTAKPAAKEPEPKTEAPAADATAAEKKLWKLKHNGKEVDFDASDEAKVKQMLEKALGAEDTFRTAAQQRQQAERFFEMLKSPAGLKKLLTDPRIGVDVKAFAEEVVWEQIQAQKREEEFKKDPSKKKAWEDEQELKRLRDDKAQADSKADADKKAEAARQFEGAYEQKILTALQGGRIPNEPQTVDRMIYYMNAAIENHIDLEPADLVEQIEKDLQGDLGVIIKALSGDQLLQWLGEAGAKKLREADMGRLRTTTDRPFGKKSDAKRAADAKADPASAPKRMAGSDWKAQLQKDFLSRNKG